MARDIKIAILGDARDFTKATKKAVGDADGMAGKVGAITKRMAIGVAAVGVGAAALGKSFVDAAIESQKVTAQTDAVIKSMGNTANVSAEQVSKLSTQLSLKSGIDDELIQSGQNVLLTFGKVRNEVGKGNDIFNKASAAALDMSVALGTDMKTASMQVGKALNDPVRGLTALRRSGIQFTKSQEEQIKAMTAAGDIAGAQKVMLGELEKQFGGSAKAQATASDKLRVAWGNVQEQLGAKLLPVVERVATYLAENLPTAMARAQEFSNRVAAAVREHWPQIQKTVADAVQQIQAIVTPIIGAIQTLWDNFGNNILEFVNRVWPRIQQVIEGVMTTIRGVIQTITSLIKGDWSGGWEGIKTTVAGVWEGIQGIVGAALEQVRLLLGVWLETVGSVISGAWDTLVTSITGLPGRIATAAVGLFDGLVEAFKTAINAIIGIWNDFHIEFDGYDIPGPGPNIPGFKIDTPNLPKLHSGGTFRAPPGRSEGLALLRDGEHVSTPEQQGGVVININGRLDRSTLADLVYEQKALALSVGRR